MTKTSKPKATKPAGRWRQYYDLTKPGIIRGNAMVAVAGFLLAAQGQIDLKRLIGLLIGSTGIIASACVVNNYIDRDIDSHMSRTKDRSLVTGSISAKAALIYAAILLLIGCVSLVITTSWLTLLLGLAGFVAYVALYTPAKRRTIHSTLIGSISGAIPPLAGYSAVHGSIDLGGIILFVILVCWQMPHFYAIAIYRRDEYQAATIPTLAVARGIRRTRLEIALYTLLFSIACAWLYLAGYAAGVYAITMAIVCLFWLYIVLRGFSPAEPDPSRWAKKVFGVSLLAILLLSISIAVDSFVKLT